MSIQEPAVRATDHVEYRERACCEVTLHSALKSGLDSVAANAVARRVSGLTGDLSAWFNPSLKHLSDPATLPDIDRAVVRLVHAIEYGEVIGICTDYDVDGITAHTLLREALSEQFGHPVDALRAYIGHRLNDGYGLSDNVCQRILEDGQRPAVVITADCGTSDGPRIERLAAAGIDVIVTDHHGVPSSGVPARAIATVNPSRDDSVFDDPAIAGCTVAWLLMAHLRRALIKAGALPDDAPKLAGSLDLVALGTVADAVSLFSPANRALVVAGLCVLNQRRRPCWEALAQLLGRKEKPFMVDDLGFQIGPRINARGRVADPLAALRFLTAPDASTAQQYLQVLDDDNQSRRDIEKRMVSIARAAAQSSLVADDQVICVFDDSFHPGVQGIVASRLLDQFGRVTAVLSPSGDPDQVSGSLRSVDGVDVGQGLRDVDTLHPGLLTKFGGHPKAAGVTLPATRIDAFRDALASVVREQIGARQLAPVRWHDGTLAPDQLEIETVAALERLTPYGRGFEPPCFAGEFSVAKARTVGADPVHLSLELDDGHKVRRAIWFRALKSAGDPWPVETGARLSCLYRLTRDDYRGGRAVQLVIEHARRVE